MKFLTLFLLFALMMVKELKAAPTDDRLTIIANDTKRLIEIGNVTYYFSEPDSYVNYGDAFQLCSNLNMLLVSFPNEDQWLAVKEYMNGNGMGETRYWSSGENMAWQWYWTSLWQEITYFDWSSGEPSGWAYIHIVAKNGWKSSSGQHAAVMCQ